ncbi:MAG: hypothetical protein JWO51_111 [Rhodospirillales bacterium]|nr:hypothetical protein [Rhodospirillales bacterium]
MRYGSPLARPSARECPTMTTPKIPEMNIVVNSDDCAPILTTMARFLADNADGIDTDEAREIAATLGRGEVYIGGSGAAPEFEIARAETMIGA